MSWRIYPDQPGLRQRTLLTDLIVVLALVVFAWLGLRVHDDIAALGQIGAGVARAGDSVRTGFSTAAADVSGIPIIGGQLAGSLRSAGASTGGSVITLGHHGESDANTAATVIGWLVFLLPAALVLQRYVPGRLAHIRRITAAVRVFEGSAADPERAQLLAQRAAFSLPYETLLRYTRDPLGDLQAGRYEALVAAVMDDAGVRPRS